MPTTLNYITIDPTDTGPVTVNLTQGGTSITSYTEANGTTGHTLPKLISTVTEFHVVPATLGDVLVSVKRNGTELAGQLVNVQARVPVTIKPALGDKVDELVPVTKYVTANVAYTSTTTLAAVTDLTFAVVAGASYKISGYIVYKGTTAGDMKIGWLCPGETPAPTGWWTSGSPAAGVSTNVTGVSIAALDSFVSDSAVCGALGTSAGEELGTPIIGFYTADQSGNLSLTAAQNASNATASTLLAGSWITFERVS